MLRKLQDCFADGFALMCVASVWALIVKLWLWALS